MKTHNAETGAVDGYDDAESITNEELLTLAVDLLVPAALENAIDGNFAADLGADVIVKAANGPITPDADDVLVEKGACVVPDILANGGSVTGSCFGWVRNRQRFYKRFETSATGLDLVGGADSDRPTDGLSLLPSSPFIPTSSRSRSRRRCRSR